MGGTAIGHRFLAVRNRTAWIQGRYGDRYLHPHNNAKKSPSATLADLKRELRKPRIAKSAKTAKLYQEITRIPGVPSVTMPGTVEKIASAQNLSWPENADNT